MKTKKIKRIGLAVFAIALVFISMTYMPNNNLKDVDNSEHFNGKKFVNPTLEKQFSPGISDIFNMMKEGRPKWPKSVENISTPTFKESIGDDELALTFVNHGTFLIQLSELNILTDPVWSERASPIGWVGPKRVRKPAVSLDSLPSIDIIVLSHNHYDHLDKETLKTLEKRDAPLVLVPLGDKKLLESFGLKNVKELDWWQSESFEDGTEIIFTPQQHSSGRGLFDRDESLWGSFFIKNGQQSIYFGGDGGYSTHFADIKTRLGSPKIALLGIGAYIPNFFMEAIHTSPKEAVKAHLDLGAEQSIGMHYGTFQLASEKFTRPQEDLAQALKENQLSDDDFIIMNEGETKFYSSTKQ